MPPQSLWPKKKKKNICKNVYLMDKYIKKSHGVREATQGQSVNFRPKRETNLVAVSILEQRGTWHGHMRDTSVILCTLCLHQLKPIIFARGYQHWYTALLNLHVIKLILILTFQLGNYRINMAITPAALPVPKTRPKAGWHMYATSATGNVPDVNSYNFLMSRVGQVARLSTST